MIVIFSCILLMGDAIKYVSQERAKQTIKLDTILIKISQGITKLLLFEDFNMANIGAAILNSQ